MIVMDDLERKAMLTAAWMFAGHGRGDRAVGILEWIVADRPTDPATSSALAALQLERGDPAAAWLSLERADFTGGFRRVGALLQARTLRALGRVEEAEARWRGYTGYVRALRRDPGSENRAGGKGVMVK